MMGYPYLSYTSSRLSFLVVTLGLDGVGFPLSSWWWSFVLLIFSISFFNLSLMSLYSEALFTSCSRTACMFDIYFCCDANASLIFMIALADSLLIPTELVVLCFMLAAYLVKKSFQLLHFLALVGLSHQVSHGRLKNPVSFMARYAERRVFF